MDDLQRARELLALDANSRNERLAQWRACDPGSAERAVALLGQLASETCFDADSNTDGFACHDDSVPERIGAYRVLRRIGEGGMGAVFLAEQSSPQRRVAIKIMRSDWHGRESSARFEREAEVLARLEHPHIARIYEAGVDHQGGRSTPYLAMEYVEGLALNEYVHGHSLAPRAIIELLMAIAEAIQHAHLRGVVHRDLKPGNILVDGSGQAHILDFGIAHLTDGPSTTTPNLTQTGQMIGTVQYMSPEQFIGDPRRIDGRSDIYALGVISFELLTGELPHRLHGSSLLDAARIVTAEQPRTLSSLRQELRGDLEWIIAKALEHDPDRRYASAADFAADLLRYVRHEPISARPPSRLYRAQRFARRHWLPLGAAMIVLLSLLGGVWVAWQAAQREGLARALAEQRADEAQAVTDFLRQMLNAAAPDQAQGKELSVRAVIDRAVADESLRPANPAARARVDQLLGSLLIELGDPAAALPLLDSATKLALPGVDQTENALRARAERAIALGLLGRRDEALADAEVVYQRTRELADVDPVLRESADYGYSLALYNLGRLEEAETAIRAGLQDLPATAGREMEGQIDLRNTLGRLLHASARYQEALEVRREVMDWYLRVYGPRTMRSISVQSNYAVTLSQLDRDTEAIALLQESLPLRLELLGPDHMEVAVHRINLGTSLRVPGRHAEALAEFQEGHRIFLSKLGSEHVRTLLAAGYVADAESHLGLADASVARFAQVLEGYGRIGEGESRWAVLARNDYALALLRLGRMDAARIEFERLDALAERHAGHRGAQAELTQARGIWHLLQQQPEAALEPLRTGMAIYRNDGKNGHGMRRLAGHLALAELGVGNVAAAEALRREFGLPDSVEIQP